MKNTFSIEKIAMPIMVAVAITGLFCLMGGCGEQSNASAPAPALQGEERIPVRTAPVEQPRGMIMMPPAKALKPHKAASNQQKPFLK